MSVRRSVGRSVGPSVSSLLMLCLDQTIGDNRCSFLSSRTSWTVPRRRARGAILPALEPPSCISPLDRVAVVEALFSFLYLVPLLPRASSLLFLLPSISASLLLDWNVGSASRLFPLSSSLSQKRRLGGRPQRWSVGQHVGIK